MNDPVIHARGAAIVKLNPAWIWPPGAGAEEAPPPAGPVLIESFPVENQNDINSYGVQEATMRSCFQCFTPSGAARLTSVKLSLQRYGEAAGVMEAVLYAAGGAYPNQVPVNGLLYSASVDVATITTDAAGSLYEFTFPNSIVRLKQGSFYGIALQKRDTGGGWGFTAGGVNAGFYFGDSGHYGNGGYRDNLSAWHADPLADMIFYLYGEPL